MKNMNAKIIMVMLVLAIVLFVLGVKGIGDSDVLVALSLVVLLYTAERYLNLIHTHKANKRRKNIA